MQVVSSNSDAELARRRATDILTDALRTLTANLIRITRGAGRPAQVADQLMTVVDAYNGYIEAVGHRPTEADVGDALYLDLELERVSAYSDNAIEEHYAEAQMIRGALQVAAAKLLDQHLQVAKGMDDLHRGASRREAALEAQRAAWAKRDKGEADRALRRFLASQKKKAARKAPGGRSKI